jgi:hypothetical protein
VSDSPKYLLDANVFMQAARQYYAFDLVPAFWKALVDHASKDRLLSIDRVKDEIERGKDELAQWANGTFRTYFVSTNEDDVLQAYGEIMRWAQAQNQYSEAAKAEFADQKNADAWIVAFAKAKGCVVVTHEQPAPESRNKIKLPDACQAFGVPWTGAFSMLRALGVRLA